MTFMHRNLTSLNSLVCVVKGQLRKTKTDQTVQMDAQADQSFVGCISHLNSPEQHSQRALVLLSALVLTSQTRPRSAVG